VARGVTDLAGPIATDVVVVGAGPVGMTAAALLAARGVAVTVLERNPSTSDEPKAISIDDEALRTFQAAGLAPRLERIIVPGTGTRYYDAAGRAVFQARSGWPYRLGHPFKNPFAQPDLERELADHLRGCAVVDLRMATEVAGVVQDGSGVSITTVAGEQLRARYVLGCDGGRSAVREQLGIAMVGRSFDEVWLVADVLGDPHDERYGMHHGNPERPAVIVPASTAAAATSSCSTTARAPRVTGRRSSCSPGCCGPPADHPGSGRALRRLPVPRAGG